MTLPLAALTVTGLGCRSAAPRGDSASDRGTAAATLARPAKLPPALAVAPELTPYLRLCAQGTQTYVCEHRVVGSGGAGGGGFAAAAWSAAVPEATLRLCDTDGGARGRHFGGPTWEWVDGSRFVGDKQGALAAASPDNAERDLPWLRVPKKSGSDGGVFGRAAFVQRIDTEGGTVVDQDAGCTLAGADAGLVVRVPYRATYLFYSHGD